MISVSAVALLTVVAVGLYGNRLVLDSVPLNGQPLEPLLPQIKALASRHSFIDGISVDPNRNAILLVVRAKHVDRARTTVNRWLDERNAKKILSESATQIIQDLHNAEIIAGSPVDPVLEGIQSRVIELGPYTQYLIPNVTDDATLILTTRARLIQSATVEHPNWNWTFFDEVPATHSTKMIEIREVTEYVADNPKSASQLNSYLERLVLSLH